MSYKARCIVQISRRRFQTVTVRRLNPYRFYDLSKKYPTHAVEKEDVQAEGLKLDDAPAATRSRPTVSDPHSLKVGTARPLSAQERAKIVFGSRLAGPQRRQVLESTYRDILGVKVPPRPSEPDNCCMSGCVNCVWELYREDFEDWQRRKRKAKAALIDAGRFDLWPEDFGPNPRDQITAEGKHLRATEEEIKKDEDDPWKGVDVGIRVFIETERRLKKRRSGEAHRTAPATGTEAAAAP
ncbi:oxidoreductase-like protein [Lipomyces kononenkoae]|uniref:Oxidoreductase-like protein n=1 Tax=Lipomyces kononenkoae TaxID=34357 RepID=A0ACC3T0U6_LIPKO